MRLKVKGASVGCAGLVPGVAPLRDGVTGHKLHDVQLTRLNGLTGKANLSEGRLVDTAREEEGRIGAVLAGKERAEHVLHLFQPGEEADGKCLILHSIWTGSIKFSLDYSRPEWISPASSRISP